MPAVKVRRLVWAVPNPSGQPAVRLYPHTVNLFPQDSQTAAEHRSIPPSYDPVHDRPLADRRQLPPTPTRPDRLRATVLIQ